MNTKAAIVAVALALTSGATLAHADQLAAQAGVEPGVYSQIQLNRIISARAEGDSTTLQFILDNPEGSAPVSRSSATFGVPSTKAGKGVSAGDRQLAAQAGVEPGVYSTTQMMRLLTARSEGQDDTVRFILENPEG